VARATIFGFFLLIVTRCVEFLAIRYGVGVRPALVYFVLILLGGLAILRDAMGRKDSPVSRSEVCLFGLMLLLAVWVAIDRGPYPDGDRLAAWTAANVIMAAMLFYFARFMKLETTIRNAALAALAMQCAAIVVDLAIPGTFAEWPPRPAGFPQNSNNGAMLIAFLSLYLLPNLSAYLLIIVPLIAATLSRSGGGRSCLSAWLR
jgi:hypothetical protein